MPVFTSGNGKAPAWCELRSFEIVRLAPGTERSFAREEMKEKWIVVNGACEASTGDAPYRSLKTGDQVDLVHRDLRIRVAGDGEATLVRMCGVWGDETGGSGLFGVVNTDAPKDFGDPADYPKTTNFDRHFHDCDEYWIIVEGRGIAVSEGKSYAVGPGDCVATGMGHHHDFPQVLEPIRAVFFETTLEGEKRLGHLWEHTHGPARPDPKRV